MPAFIKTPEDEKLWKHAKKIALKALHNREPSTDVEDNKILSKGNSWGFVTDRYKKLKSGEIKKGGIQEALALGFFVKKISLLT
jgi:hypothetical protein